MRLVLHLITKQWVGATLDRSHIHLALREARLKVAITAEVAEDINSPLRTIHHKEVEVLTEGRLLRVTGRGKVTDRARDKATGRASTLITLKERIRRKTKTA